MSQIRNRRVKEENYQKLYDYLKKHPCVDCGEKDYRVLDFDHVRGKKKDAVTMLVRSAYKWATIVEEIKKCVVRCSNCHRRKTAKQFKWRCASVDQKQSRQSQKLKVAGAGPARGTKISNSKKGAV